MQKHEIRNIFAIAALLASTEVCLKKETSEISVFNLLRTKMSWNRGRFRLYHAVEQQYKRNTRSYMQNAIITALACAIRPSVHKY